MTKDISKRLQSVRNNTNSHWILDDGLRRLNFWMVVCVLSSYAGGYDGTLFVGLLTLTPWFAAMFDFSQGAPTAVQVGSIGVSGVIGFLLGPHIGQYISDRYGRHRAIIASCFVAIPGGVLTVVTLSNQTHQRYLFICARVILSIGGSMGMVSAPVLITELSHPRQRPVLMALYQSGFFFGSIMASWICFGTNEWTSSWCWRLPSLLQILPFVAQLTCVWWCPHSPRYLVAQGRPEEAKELLAKYHANGDMDDELVNFEMEEIVAAVSMDARNKSSFMDLFATKGNRKRVWIIVVLAFITQWSGNGVITYYLPEVLDTLGITASRTQAAFNGGLATFNLVVACCASMLPERLGRRTLFLISATGMLCSFIIFTALSATFAKTNDASYGRAVVAFLFIFYFFYDLSLVTLAFLYPAEILPYKIRSRGLALSISTVAVALVFNIFVNPIALAAISWKFYIVYVGTLTFFLVNVILFFPETKGKTIEEIEILFDGPNQAPVLPELGRQAEHDDLGSASSDIKV